MRAVVGFEHLYGVTEEGSVVSLRSGKALKPGGAGKGYLIVSLCEHGVDHKRYVHRLVCEAFHGPALGRHTNHKDGAKRNNRPENLEWVTPLENNQHAIRTGFKPDASETARKGWVTRRKRGMNQKPTQQV